MTRVGPIRWSAASRELNNSYAGGATDRNGSFKSNHVSCWTLLRGACFATDYGSRGSLRSAVRGEGGTQQARADARRSGPEPEGRKTKGLLHICKPLF